MIRIISKNFKYPSQRENSIMIRMISLLGSMSPNHCLVKGKVLVEEMLVKSMLRVVAPEELRGLEARKFKASQRI